MKSPLAIAATVSVGAALLVTPAIAAPTSGAALAQLGQISANNQSDEVAKRKGKFVIKTYGLTPGVRATVKIKGVSGKAKGQKKVLRVGKKKVFLVKKKRWLKPGRYIVRTKSVVTNGTWQSRSHRQAVRVGKHKRTQVALLFSQNNSGVVTQPRPDSRVDQPAEIGALARAISSTGCTEGYRYPGTTDETIDVTLPGKTMIVVCAGNGTDTVNINSVGNQGNDDTQLWLAFGTGDKTINWSAGGGGFGDNTAGAKSNQFILVRPDSNNNVVATGNTNNNFTYLMCGDADDFKTAAGGHDLPSYIRFRTAAVGVPQNNNNC